ncbi:pirin family protein, partial [Paenibacillus sp.]|uniref:pirin family protein n=1 Tax=Paenibacillus sp. TaxID=58172 RepID=UPI002D4AFD6F
MIRVVPSESRHASDYGWLKNKVSFSVGDYFDPDNIRFGPLRVFNEDVVQPSTGFGAHGHQEMEIVTIVLEGQLEH